jgi:hypothetical protein
VRATPSRRCASLSPASSAGFFTDFAKVTVGQVTDSGRHVGCGLCDACGKCVCSVCVQSDRTSAHAFATPPPWFCGAAKEGNGTVEQRGRLRRHCSVAEALPAQVKQAQVLSRQWHGRQQAAMGAGRLGIEQTTEGSKSAS